MKKTMKITLTEDFLVPTEDGNIIFEPGDEIEVEYDDTSSMEPDQVVDPIVGEIGDGSDPLTFAGVEPEPETIPPVSNDPVVNSVVDPVMTDSIIDPIVDPEDTIGDDDEVFIEDPTLNLV